MRLLPKSIHRCRRYPTKFNSGRDIPTEKGRWASKHKAEKLAVIRMEFRTFVNAFIRVPAQIIRQGRKTIYRLLAWNPWQPVFLRGFDELAIRMRC